VRSALGTLPWVEKATIQTDVKTREVRFGLTDKSAFSEDALKTALKKQGFPQMTVKAKPESRP
jgi:hypothetical protein